MLTNAISKAADILDQIMTLPEDQRASLANDILDSLPSVLADDDEGIAEARRRSQEMDSNPDLSMTWAEIKSGLGR